MATTTKIVRGRYFDGCTTTLVAKKINDITTAAANIYGIAIAKSGQELVAVIVYN
jgi:hypothetical protein